MFSGDFEVHLTGSEWEVDKLSAFAEQNGAKFSHIQLQRGAMPSQPMLTVSSNGTLADLHEVAARWRANLEAADLSVLRVKIEAAPWNEGVPQFDEEARADLYFEHHVKVLLPVGGLSALTSTAQQHEAHVSRNARRKRDDGREERFVTQRCHRVGRLTAQARLDALLTALRVGWYEVLEVEEEYVVHDDALHIDRGWLEHDPAADWHASGDERLRTAPAGTEGFPSTYLPLAVKPRQDIRQRAAFDPALKHFAHAFRAGEPVFGNDTEGERWLAARRAAMGHTLAVVATSPWAEHLVLRGSVVLRAWLGDAAREPGDLDFVVTPRTFASDSSEAKAVGGGRRHYGALQREVRVPRPRSGPCWTDRRDPCLADREGPCPPGGGRRAHDQCTTCRSRRSCTASRRRGSASGEPAAS
ncbi:nucleotidyl transferase AbiEii/AbiGii toxin family protein [Kibdelosporangium philippinense]|uniref:Nucleotidyl transferase AbiEii/AbiGii toxin family protein n=1 Tax=Kibdelosporangium philippinense TaxID=211113 RepID=A0ABS8ZL82_9PSEU|nr:nucleotidyl transferase AbiEii/AbiGii toxin family protein [Kibdelosporangium philippinense]MCE7008539.1 nucleotidyl transferase AbiEii/AbiGii toxin family protein [Kibdelosporangium philippinense]